ncbi:MAG: DNA repair protein RecO [Lawsonella clevelandensis]
MSDYGRYTAAAAILEATERLLGEEQPNPRLFDLTVGVLGALAEGRREPQQMVDTYLLRAMAEAGWAPELEKCAVCGAKGPHQAFHPAAGGVVCAQHRPPTAPPPCSVYSTTYGRYGMRGGSALMSLPETESLVRGCKRKPTD